MSQRTIRAKITCYKDGGINLDVFVGEKEVDDIKKELTRAEKIRLRHTLGLYRDKIDRFIKEENKV